MKFSNIILFLTTLMLLFSSCRKNTDETVWEEENKIDLDGFIINEEGLPIAEASIVAGGKVTLTDIYGYFKVEDALSQGDFVYIQANKAGYLEGSRLVSARASDDKHLRIKMLPEQFDYSFDMQTSGSIIVDDEVRIDFPPSSIADANGNIYTGEVKASVHYIDPTTPEGQLEMPGNLIGTDANEETVSLSSYGMIAVELRGTNNEQLNIASGKKVTIAVKVPVSLQNSAPNTIPLWHFDQDAGRWIEEGVATLSGGQYVGEVSHFSFWNCDYPNELIYIKGRIVARSIGVETSIKIKADDGTQRSTFTDDNGIFEGYVPENLGLTLLVYDFCGDVVKTLALGPLEGDNNLGNIDIGPTFITNENLITGTVRDCNGVVLEGVSVNVNGASIGSVTDSDGRFEYLNSTCNLNDVEVKAFDFASQIQGVVNVLPGKDNDVDIILCNDNLDLEEYMYIEMSNGESFFVQNFVGEAFDNVFGVYLETSNNLFGHVYHNQENYEINTNLPVERFFLSTDLVQGPPAVQTVFIWGGLIVGSESYIRYSSKAEQEGEYTEGVFEMRQVAKQKQSNGQFTLIESGITVNGQFKIKFK